MTRAKGNPVSSIAQSRLELKLLSGSARPRGARLSQEECSALYDIVVNAKKRPPGRPWDDFEIENLAKAVTVYVWLLEARGVKIESAVAEVAELYGVSRSTVFAARKRWVGPFREAGLFSQPPAIRDLLLKKLKGEFS
jgi:hypothetical protein